MTAIKQVSVTSRAHGASLKKYLNSDKALDRATQYIARDDRWSEQMDRTREAYGHNVASRTGANNTIMYHQIIGFNPDECDINGGKMTPDKCMEYARDYIKARYHHQEAVYVLHREHCKADGTDRYAVHIGINRTNLETGCRLDEGKARTAAISRANTMKDLDRDYGLRQMEAGKRNSRVHDRQETKAEREMKERGKTPEKEIMRQEIRAAKEHVMGLPEEDRPRAFADELRKNDIVLSRNKNNKDFQFFRAGVKINGATLGGDFEKESITLGLLNVEKNPELKIDDMAKIALQKGQGLTLGR